MLGIFLEVALFILQMASSLFSWPHICACRPITRHGETEDERVQCAKAALDRYRSAGVDITEDLETDIPDELMEEYLRLKENRVLNLETRLSEREVEILEAADINGYISNPYVIRRHAQKRYK